MISEILKFRLEILSANNSKNKRINKGVLMFMDTFILFFHDNMVSNYKFSLSLSQQKRKDL